MESAGQHTNAEAPRSEPPGQYGPGGAAARVANSVSEAKLLQRLRWEVDRLDRELNSMRHLIVCNNATAEQHLEICQAVATLSDFRKAIGALTIGRFNHE
jgi:hypothetical protein